MAEGDEDKTTFISDRGVYCYSMMSFDLKNDGLTNQRLLTPCKRSRLDRIWRCVLMICC